MKIVLDARGMGCHPEELALKPGGGWVLRHLGEQFALMGHNSHIILDGSLEMEKNQVNYWPQDRHPETCDVFISPGSVTPTDMRSRFSLSGGDYLKVWPYFSMPHVQKVPDKVIWMAAPESGLWHMREIWNRVHEEIPGASLVIGHGVGSYIETFRGEHDFQGVESLALEKWIESDSSVVALRPMDRDDTLRHIAEAQIYAYPRSAISAHGFTRSLSAGEAAAAGCALLFSTDETLARDFDGHAAFMPSVWDYGGWAEILVRWMRTPGELAEWQNKALSWGKRNTSRIFQKEWRKLLGA